MNKGEKTELKGNQSDKLVPSNTPHTHTHTFEPVETDLTRGLCVAYSPLQIYEKPHSHVMTPLQNELLNFSLIELPPWDYYNNNSIENG